MHHQINVGVAFCTPSPFVLKPGGLLGHKPVTMEWHRHRMSLQMGTNIQYYELAIDGKEVGDARNIAADRAMNEVKAEFLFFIDSDVILPYDGLKKLMKRAREFPDFDIFTGVYCTKDPNPEPLIYMQDGTGPYWDWAIGDLLFDIASCGMGCTLIRTSLFERLEHSESNPWFLTTNTVEEGDGGLSKNRGTEDIYFCNRARNEADARIMADTSVLCGHQDLTTGVIHGIPEDSLPYKRARWMRQNDDVVKKEMEESGKKLQAIDLGFGGTFVMAGSNRHTQYQWSSLDIRPECKPDYVMDLRGLNFPADHWDLVFSSHTLEHIGRWDQEKVWSEIFRVCKPGGRCEMWIPNFSWAAKHVVDGVIDKHVLNVIYGAQEEHGYERIFNTHFFPYTPDIARELCESAGFENVSVETYLDEPMLKYNLVLRGEKPVTVEATESDEKQPDDNRTFERDGVTYATMRSTKETADLIKDDNGQENRLKEYDLPDKESKRTETGNREV